MADTKTCLFLGGLLTIYQKHFKCDVGIMIDRDV